MAAMRRHDLPRHDLGHWSQPTGNPNLGRMNAHPCSRAVTLVAVVLVTACAGTSGSTPAPSPSAAPPNPSTSPSIAAATPDVGGNLTALLDARRVSYHAPGGLALVRDGGAAWTATSGSADTAGTAITATTRFRIASITKPIVAALVLQAVDRGEVS